MKKFLIVSTGMFDFDVTFRGRPGETTVSIINLDVRNEATPSAHEALLNALTEAHGSGDKAINDENIGALLIKTTWGTEKGSVELIYLDDFWDQHDRVSIEYRNSNARDD